MFYVRVNKRRLSFVQTKGIRTIIARFAVLFNVLFLRKNDIFYVETIIVITTTITIEIIRYRGGHAENLKIYQLKATDFAHKHARQQ